MVDFCEDSNTVLGCVGGDGYLDILSKYPVVKNNLLNRIRFHIIKIFNQNKAQFIMP